MPGRRTELEALQVVASLYPGIDEDIKRYLALSHLNWDEKYCDSCGKTGTVFKIKEGKHKFPGNNVVSDNCFCVKFARMNTECRKKSIESGIPEKYWSASIDSCVNPGRNTDEISINDKSLHLIKNYCANLAKCRKKGYGIYLCGLNGVGKTYIANAIGVRAILNNYTVQYYTATNLVNHLIKRFDDREELYQQIINVDFLIIDDFDKIIYSKSSFDSSILESILRPREQNNRCNIITSNLALVEIAATHGVAVQSLLTRCCVELTLVGEDLSKKISEDIYSDIINGNA